jgi:integrase/recombinase XerD
VLAGPPIRRSAIGPPCRGVTSRSSEPRRVDGEHDQAPSMSPCEAIMSTTARSAALLPFQPSSMSPAQLSAVSYLACYSGATHALYAAQLRRWFGWCDANGLDPLVGIQRAHVELYIRQHGEEGLMDSSVNAMMHAVRAYFRFAHIDGTIPADPAVYARLPKSPSRRGPDPGLGPLGADPVSAGRADHHGPPWRLVLPARDQRPAGLGGRGGPDRGLRDLLRGYRVLHLIGNGNKPANMPLTVPVLRVLEACRGERSAGPLLLRPVSGKPIDRRDVYTTSATGSSRATHAAAAPAAATGSFACDNGVTRGLTPSRTAATPPPAVPTRCRRGCRCFRRSSRCRRRR